MLFLLKKNFALGIENKKPSVTFVIQSGSDCKRNAKVAQLVERNLAKVEVEGSNPFFRSREHPYTTDAFSFTLFV